MASAICVSGMENLALRVPYVYGKDYIGGYLGCPEKQYTSTMDDQFYRYIGRRGRTPLLDEALPLFLATSKTMYSMRPYLPRFTIFNSFNPAGYYFFACDHLSSLEDAKTWLLSHYDMWREHLHYDIRRGGLVVKPREMKFSVVVWDGSSRKIIDLEDHSILLSKLQVEGKVLMINSRFV